MDEIIRADRRYRNRCLFIVALLSVVGALLLFWGLPALRQSLSRSSPHESLRLLRWLLTALFAPCAVIAAYLLLLARRIRRAGQYPPPGMAVIKDTKVRRGASAVSMARVLVVLAAVLLLAAVLGGYYFPWVWIERLVAR